MFFNSIFFLFLFLPIFLTIYYLINPKLRNIYLVIVSLIFYFWGMGELTWIILLSVLFNFICGLILDSPWRKPKFKKLFLFASIGFNVLYLGYFKYASFFVTSANKIISLLGMNNIFWSSVALPLAISFFTFQQISYLIDVYKGERSTKNIIQYTLFVTLFPKLIAGPLVRWKEFLPQIKERKKNSEKFFEGTYRFVVGLAQKVIIANILGEFVGTYFTEVRINTSLSYSWLVLLTFTFQIFFDFAGYTNMAIGLGKMIGFDFPENFKHPYLSKSITEFWRRWHITLGVFLRDYLYISLGGNRVSKWRNILNFIIVFGIGGLWHGAGLHFLVWGIYYGILLGAEKHFYGKYLAKLPSFFQVLITFIFVMLGWVLFQAPSFYGVWQIFKNLFIPNNLAFVISIEEDRRFFFVLIVAFLLVFAPAVQQIKINFLLRNSVLIKGLAMVILLILSAMFMAAQTFQPFIYQQF